MRDVSGLVLYRQAVADRRQSSPSSRDRRLVRSLACIDRRGRIGLARPGRDSNTPFLPSNFDGSRDLPTFAPTTLDAPAKEPGIAGGRVLWQRGVASASRRAVTSGVVPDRKAPAGRSSAGKRGSWIAFKPTRVLPEPGTPVTNTTTCVFWLCATPMISIKRSVVTVKLNWRDWIWR